jgi:hypothetical protein
MMENTILIPLLAKWRGGDSRKDDGSYNEK